MAISGQQPINIGAINQVANSDSLYVAFNKVQNNFSTLFNTASPFNTFRGDAGISAYGNTSNGVVTITNTGVLSLTEGTGISLSGSNGNIVISAVSTGNVGVTRVGVLSSTLSVSNSPIVSAGNITVDLPIITPSGSFAAGEYSAPTITVDVYGRINAIANTTSIGTVTSVAVEAVGDGLSITNSPITSSGIIEITNTGVTRIRGGTGISLSGETGEVTIFATNTNEGTVSRIDVTSNNLTVTGSPVTSTGTVTVDIPDNITLSGNVIANTLTANTNISTYNLTVSNLANIATANIPTLTSSNIIGYFNGVIGNVTPNVGTFTNVTASGNVTSSYVKANNQVIANTVSVINTGSLYFTTGSNALALANYTKFYGSPSPANTSFILPASDGTQYGVLGTDGQFSTSGNATLSFRNIVAQYFYVLLRNGVTSVTVPDTVVRRKESILARDGTSYIDVSVY